MNDSIRQAILFLLAKRIDGATICPSEAARTLWPENWRVEMPRVRETAVRMAHAGELELCQGGKVVDPAGFRGPIRLRLPVT